MAAKKKASLATPRTVAEARAWLEDRLVETLATILIKELDAEEAAAALVAAAKRERDVFNAASAAITARRYPATPAAAVSEPAVLGRALNAKDAAAALARGRRVVLVDADDYVRSHGKSPAGRGHWAFSTVPPSRADYLDHLICVNDSYRAARAAAVKQALARGLEVLYVCS